MTTQVGSGRVRVQKCRRCSTCAPVCEQVSRRWWFRCGGAWWWRASSPRRWPWTACRRPETSRTRTKRAVRVDISAVRARTTRVALADLECRTATVLRASATRPVTSSETAASTTRAPANVSSFKRRSHWRVCTRSNAVERGRNWCRHR